MYRDTSPIFDIPEFPTLRRVKPLPKRRRTSDTVERTNLLSSSLEELNMQMPGPDATAEELLAHADSLSAHMALQSYYMPILGGVQELLRNSILEGEGGQSNSEEQTRRYERGDATTTSSFDFLSGYKGRTSNEGGIDAGKEDEASHGDGDYNEHLPSSGNAKKRKVPVNMTGSPRGSDAGSGRLGEYADKSLFDGLDTAERSPAPTPPGSQGSRRTKMSAATLAGLRHKEMLRSRKKQLAAVLGALSLGDTLVLDQALASTQTFTTSAHDGTKDTGPPRINLSRRKGPRLRRTAKLSQKLRPHDGTSFPACQFTFAYPSATAHRLIATKEEVTLLRKRFEAELARQASKTKLAAAEKRSPAKGSRSKRAERQQRRPRTSVISGDGAERPAEFLEQTALTGKKTRSAKKKRSALANAANPHHLRNYVPSRFPHSIQHSTNQTSQSYLGPQPLKFLSADLPPRRSKASQPLQATTQLTNPAEEWICAFCEYELFYGDELEYRRAIRNRKKILKRRQRARERAAAAASGSSTVKVPEKSNPVQEEYDAEFEVSATGEFTNSPNPRLPKWKGDPNKQVEKGG